MNAKTTKVLPDTNRKVSLMMDGTEFSYDNAITEAKNCYGVGHGVTLLAEKLVDGMLDASDYGNLYLDKPIEYIKACVANAMYDVYLAGAVLLAEMKSTEYNRLFDILEKMPIAEREGRAPDGSTPQVRLLQSLDDLAAMEKMVDDIEFLLQELVERGYEGSGEFEKERGTSNFKFSL